MCGILGFSSRRTIEVRQNLMPERGPDGWGTISRAVGEVHVTLFHSRLQIIGLGDQGRQPFELDPGYMLVYNGEIYNYREIRKALARECGCAFVTETDTEVLYRALRTWPLEKVLHELNGIFAFGFLDSRAKRLIVVRDHMGVKPLYWCLTKEGGFAFSSEIEPLERLGLVCLRLRRDVLGEYFAQGWVCEPDTVWEGVYKLGAGRCLDVDLSAVSPVLHEVAYWRVEDAVADEAMPDVNAIVRRQLVSDVPAGNYFSGGVDSSIVTYALKDEGLLNLHLSLGDAESDRVTFMERRYGLNVKRIAADESLCGLYSGLVRKIDEPIADPAIIASYWLAKKARELGCRVMLSGMGGDELDAGYTRAKVLARLGQLRMGKYVPRGLCQLLFSGKRRRDALRLLAFLRNPEPEEFFNLFGYFSHEEIDGLVGAEWFCSYRDKVRGVVDGVEGNRRFFLYDVKGFLASHNNVYVDKTSMAASVECRTPLLDKDLARYLFSDVDNPKNAGKKRLGGLLKSELGEGYDAVKKAGFRFPVVDHLRSQVDWKRIEAVLTDEGVNCRDMLKRELPMLDSKPDEVYMQLWSLYTLGIKAG